MSPPSEIFLPDSQAAGWVCGMFLPTIFLPFKCEPNFRASHFPAQHSAIRKRAGKWVSSCRCATRSNQGKSKQIKLNPAILSELRPRPARPTRPITHSLAPIRVPRIRTAKVARHLAYPLPPSFILHPSSFILHPSLPPLRPTLNKKCPSFALGIPPTSGSFSPNPFRRLCNARSG
jgi:hypothetical protein